MADTTNNKDQVPGNATPPPGKKKKAPKKKGPIRVEAIAPFTIVVLLIWAYFFFFFDTHVRHALEFVGTQANGAEVNIGRLKTSFWAASLDIDNVQVTSATEPTKNKIQIGKVRWNVLWDALLRGKIAIEHASILEIAIGAPRSRPGRVLPPPPPPTDKPSAFTKMKEDAMKRAEDEFNKNVLGDAAALLKGTDPMAQLKNIEGELKSSARIKQLQDELGKKQAEWKARLDRLPQGKDIQALQDKIKTVKLDKFNNPAEVQQSLQQLDSIFKEADAKIKEVQSTHQALNGDVNTYQNSLKELQDMVNKDIKDLESRLKIPKLDVATLSSTLFGPMILQRLKQGEFYMDKAREYMPPKKTKEEKKEFVPSPHERAKGRNYKFGRPNSYPLFWLKKAQISSKATAGADWSGDLTGSLIDVTDDQPVIGRPTVALFKGDFPKQRYFGIDGKVTLDHRTEKPVESLDLKIGAFPVVSKWLVDSPDVKIGIEGASGSTTVNAQFSGDDLKIASATGLQKPHSAKPEGPSAAAPGTPGAPASASFLKSEAQQPILADILKGALADITRVTLNASVNGKWTAPSFDIDSNLGRELAGAFEKQFRAKVAEARAKLENFVNEQVGKEKEKLMAEFNKQKAMIDNLLKQKEAEVNKAKGSIENAKNEAMKSQGKKLEQEGKKAVDDLKKKFGF